MTRCPAQNDSPRCDPARRGFTMLELLVSLLIIGLLLALLIPAVQGVRESARRTHCLSNLRQILIAFHHYESTWDAFPGRSNSVRWQHQILSHLERTDDSEHCPIYACPSDPMATGDIRALYYSYLGNDGVGENGLGGVPGNGLLGWLRPVQARDVTDGLSNTVAVAERLVWPDMETTATVMATPPYAIRRLRRTAGFRDDIDEFRTECAKSTAAPIVFWYVVSGYNHVMTPNQNSCLNGTFSTAAAHDSFAVTATSAHPGLVHCAFADGAVRPISDNVDVHVWRSIGTRNGNESLGLVD